MLPIAVAGPRTCERDDTEYENKATDSECCCRCRHAMTWRGARVSDEKCTGERKTSCVGAVASGRNPERNDLAHKFADPVHRATRTGPTSPKGVREPGQLSRMKMNCL